MISDSVIISSARRCLLQPVAFVVIVFLLAACGPSIGRLYKGAPLPTEKICLVGTAPSKQSSVIFASVKGSLTIDSIDGIPTGPSYYYGNYYELLPGKHVILSYYTSELTTIFDGKAPPRYGKADCPPLEFVCEGGKIYLIEFSYRGACELSTVDVSADPKYQKLLKERTR